MSKYSIEEGHVEQLGIIISELRELRDQVLVIVRDYPEIEANFEAYGQYGFEQLLNEGNPYDSGLEDIINQIRERGDDEIYGV